MEDEAKAVAAVAARCLTWSGWRRWEPVMRYGRLFTPGIDAVRGESGMFPEQSGRRAYRLAVDAGLLYAEGYAGYPRDGVVSWPWPWAWCLDGETVVDPAATRQGTAYFGVALRPHYLHRVYAARRGDDASEGFRWAFACGDREIPPLDPATDLALDLGQDIPSAVREWALTAERHPGPPRTPPDWILAELLGGGAPGPADRNQFHDWWAPAPRDEEPFPAVRVRTRATRSVWPPGSNPGSPCAAAPRLAALTPVAGTSWASSATATAWPRCGGWRTSTVNSAREIHPSRPNRPRSARGHPRRRASRRPGGRSRCSAGLSITPGRRGCAQRERHREGG
jgi:hypothetical protein